MRQQVKTSNNSRIPVFARKSRQIRQPSPTILKTQPITENIVLLGLKCSPVRPELYTAPFWLIDQHAQLDVRCAVRSQLLDEILLRHPCIEHTLYKK